MNFWFLFAWAFIQTFSLSYIQQVLHTYCVPGIRLDTRDAMVNKTGKIPTIMKLIVHF